MDEDEQETVADISAKTWNIMENSLRKEGYREGASSGKESVLQSSFDSGYSEGFKLAYAKGFLRGFLNVLENEKKPALSQLPEATSDLSSIPCILCNAVNPEVRNGSIEEVFKYVKDITHAETISLQAKYSDLLRMLDLEPDVISNKI